jgi:DNA-binding GntR family transcriptional regulator
VPLYFQIAEAIERAIDSGELAPGERLDNEIELSERLGVSRPTVRQAIQRLVQQGLLVRRRGVGTVVVSHRIRRPVGLTSLYDDLAATGRNPTTAVLSLRTAPAGQEVASALSLAPGSEVVMIERVRSADGVPLAVMTNYLPEALLAEPLSAELLEDHGLYEVLRARGIQLHLAHQVIAARRATSREARLLGAPRGVTVLTMARTAYDSNGGAVEFGRHAYLGSDYSYEMTLVLQ